MAEVNDELFHTVAKTHDPHVDRVPQVYGNFVTSNELPAPGLYHLGRHVTEMFAVSSPMSRPDATKDDNVVYNFDVTPLLTRLHPDYDGETVVLGNNRKHGIEVELMITDKEGNPASVYHVDGVPYDPSFPPEVYKSTAEIDQGPDTNINRLIKSKIVAEIGRVATILDEYELFIDPASARMQDVPEISDMTPSLYTDANSSVFGADRWRKFIAAGVHGHHELDLQLAPEVMRYLRPLTYLFNAGLLAAPHAYGEITPDLYKHVGEYAEGDDDAILKRYHGVQAHSVRYPVRRMVSVDGGIGRFIDVANLDEVRDEMEKTLHDPTKNHPARFLGAHADRIRPDSPNGDLEHMGRIELCGKDTGANRFNTVAAYVELTGRVLSALEAAVASGKTHKLHEASPALFGASFDKSHYEGVQLPNAHVNNMEMAYYGTEAKVLDLTGVETTIPAQMEELFRFTEIAGFGVPQHVKRQIRRSLVPTNELIDVMKSRKDEQGLPSLRGYYATGLGTPAQWMIARAEAMRANGVKSDEDIMRSGTLDRTRSFRTYLAKSITRSSEFNN